MRKAPNFKLERYRREGPPHTNSGWFVIPREEGDLRIMVTDGVGWDHVSVSLAHRCPTWEEMCQVKDLVFREDEVAMQLHPARKDYVNYHPYCLHLWRPQTPEEIAAIRAEWQAAGEPCPAPLGDVSPIPLPPAVLVGPRTPIA